MSAAKTVLITGGSRGIGAATVRRFAEADWKVYFTYISNQAAATEMESATGAHAMLCDVGSETEIMATMALLDGDGVVLDALVNNAGITQGRNGAWSRSRPQPSKKSAASTSSAPP